MSKIEKDIRVSVKTGTSFPAKVVSTFQGKASVMMLSNGAIYRDLDVVGGSVIVGQDVKIDFTTHKPTVLSGRFSEPATTSGTIYGGGGGSRGGTGSGNFTEGPGIDILTSRIGFGGDTCLIYNSDGEPVEEFEATSAGLADGLSAMDAGDVLELPNILIAGGPWTISNGTLRGQSRFRSILQGQLTVGNDCVAEHLSIVRLALTDTTSYGIILQQRSRANNCYVFLEGPNNTRGISSFVRGYCYANDNIIIANCTGTGTAYAYYCGHEGEEDNAMMHATGGYVKATTAPVWEQEYV